jgi:PadR family transcriptional regulator, regulatory protein PadR
VQVHTYQEQASSKNHASLDIRQEMEDSGVVEHRGEGKMAPSTDLLQGTLDMLILQTLAPGREHGWAIAQRIQQMSNDVLQVGQGSLYPALHRLEYKGWIRAEWGASENNRRARFYSLTAAGRKQLDAELKNWDRLAGAVNLVLQRA